MTQCTPESVDVHICGRKVEGRDGAHFAFDGALDPTLNAYEDARVRLAAAITPDGIPRGARARLGVFVWRMLGELQAPLLRRHANGAMWRQALRRNQAATLEYLMRRDADGVRTSEDASSSMVEVQRQ
jgi:hypothetical protein